MAACVSNPVYQATSAETVAARKRSGVSRALTRARLRTKEAASWLQASDLHSKDDKAAAACPKKLWVRTFLAPAC